MDQRPRWQEGRDFDIGKDQLWVYIEGPEGVHRVSVSVDMYMDITTESRLVEPPFQEPVFLNVDHIPYPSRPMTNWELRTRGRSRYRTENQRRYAQREQSYQDQRRRAEEEMERERAAREQKRREEEAKRQPPPTSSSSSSFSWNVYFDMPQMDDDMFNTIFGRSRPKASPPPKQAPPPPKKPRIDPKQQPASRMAALDELRKIGKSGTQVLTDKQLYRRAMHRAHPDKGGSHESAVRVELIKVYLGIK